MFHIISATRLDEKSFYERSMLGRCLGSSYSNYGIRQSIFFENTDGLAKAYNKIILDSGSEDEILIFVHDDIFICDFFWPDRIVQGLGAFDIIGLAGNKCRAPRQPSWAFREFNEDHGFIWDEQKNLSGVVGHGEDFPCSLSLYGNVFQPCILLDGLFLSARRSFFLKNKILCDEIFDFHFYDMDLCRQTEAKKLAAGTVPLSVIHKSGGNFGSPAWREAYRKYLEKWGE